MGHGWWSLCAGQEVGHAGDDADGDFRLNLEHRITEDPNVATRKHLSTLQIRGSSTAGLVDVALDIRVSDQGKSPHLSRSH